ncbi:TonB-dependent receptor [Chitinophaga parva]|nr:TonB-dependent receptor [Chitinophaga parva]
MRLTTFLMLVSVLQLHAKTEAQNISFSGTNVSVEKALMDIERQTHYGFFWNDQPVGAAPRISVHFSNYTLPQALDEILKGLPLTYRIENKFVYIVPRNPAPPPVLPVPEFTIHGTVTDSVKAPIPGVTIMVKGTSRGTATGVDGSYTLVVKKGDVLLFSHLGYIPKEVVVGLQEVIDVQLTPQANSLNDIVVIGYGTQQRKDVTGAIAAIGPKELKQSPVANISNALAGRLPGLITVQNSGEPGADGSALYIRGFGTTGNNSPLVLVDGIQRDFSSIDPNEVANITILKDAASTAIYGIRGANGVVLVTTRRGTNAKPSFNITAQNGWQSPTRLPEYANAYDALTLFREGLVNDGLSTTQYTDEILNHYKDRSKPAYEYLYPSVDWLGTMLKPYSTLTQANLNVKGGNDFARYFVSMSYLRQNGLYNFENQIKQYDIQAVTNKYNFRSNIDLQISRDLSMELNLGAIVRDRNYPGTSAQDLFTAMKQTPSWWYPLKNPDGSVPGTPNLSASPYALLVNSGYQRLFETTLQSTAGFKWDMHRLVEGLSSRVRLSFDNLNYRNVARSLSGSTYKYNLLPGVEADTVTDLAANGTYQTINQGNGTLDYQVTANGTRRTTLELFLNYDRSFGKHNVHAVAVYNQSSYFADVSSDQSNAIAGLPYKYDGLVGRVSYNYDNRYLAELNAGYNGSENFAAGKRLGFFPAVSAGWVISQEHFIRDNASFNFINNLKLRGSYGVVGNDQIGGARFLYLTAWTITNGGYQFGVNHDGNSNSGANETQIGNPDITWEKSRNADVGLDIDLWNGGLSISADYFKNHRSNILLTSQLISATLGLTNIPPTNGGVIDNHGYEISVEHRKEFRKQGYSIRFNASYARNKILYYAEPPYTGREWQAVTGTEVGSQYGYTSLGLYRNADDVAKSPDQSFFGQVQPGDVKYKDLNGDGVINSLDQGYLPGKVNTPRSILGLSLSYHYGPLDVSVFMQAGLGGTVMTTGAGIFPFSRFAGVLQDVINNHWVASAPDKNYEFPRISSQDNVNNQQTSTFWLKSSDYLRLKTFEIGYSFPKSMLRRIGFADARVFANGINLMTWDKLKIFDPEIANGGTGTYPQQKVVNAGLTFTF